MKKAKRKIIGGAVISVCALCATATGSRTTNKNYDGTVTVSALPAGKTPIIVLDAGHGAST